MYSSQLHVVLYIYIYICYCLHSMQPQCQGDRAPAYISTSWSGMQQLTCNLHMGTYMHHSCVHVQVVLLLHPAPTCTDGCWCPIPLTCSSCNLCWLCFSFLQLTQTLYLHLWWLPFSTCADGLFLVALVHILHVHIATCTV